MQCEAPVTIEARELFADALERAVSSEHGAVAYESWADHPFYDDLGSPDPGKDAEHLAGVDSEQTTSAIDDDLWAAHPYYDDLDATPVTVCDVEERCEYEDNPALGEETVCDVEERCEYEDDPALEEETVCDVDQMQESEDYARHEDDEPDDVPWEDHPYYDTPDEETECSAESEDLDVACQDNSSEEEVEWEDSPFY